MFLQSYKINAIDYINVDKNLVPCRPLPSISHPSLKSIFHGGMRPKKLAILEHF